MFASVGSLLSGLAAVAAAWSAMNRLRATVESDCDKRLEAYREGLREGRA